MGGGKRLLLWCRVAFVILFALFTIINICEGFWVYLLIFIEYVNVHFLFRCASLVFNKWIRKSYLMNLNRKHSSYVYYINHYVVMRNSRNSIVIEWKSDNEFVRFMLFHGPASSLNAIKLGIHFAKKSINSKSCLSQKSNK